MINNLSILLSLGIIIYVTIRAAVLDKRRPWFDRAAPPVPPPGRARPAARALRRR